MRSQIRVVENVDTSLERTRLTFSLLPNTYGNDVITLSGPVPVPPGQRVRLTLEYVSDEEA